MSLLADLLSRVRRPEPKREVPPLLKKAVRQSAHDTRRQKRLLISAMVAVVIVAAGTAAVFWVDQFGKPRSFAPVATNASSSVPIIRQNDPDIPSSKPASDEAKIITSQVVVPIRVSGQKKTARSRLATVAGGDVPSAIDPVKSPAAADMTAQDKDIFLFTARTFEQKGLFQRALTDYGKVLALDPGNYVVMNNMANACLQLGKPAEAVRYAEEALTKKADYVPALVNLGIAHSRTGQHNAGEACLERALRLAPSDRAVLLNMALLQEKKGAFAKAREFYSRLSMTGEAQGYLGLARVAEKESRVAEAVHCYQTAMTLEKRDSPLWRQANERLQELVR